MEETKSILCLNNRESLSVTGVLEVVSFERDAVELLTSNGTLCVGGEEMRISSLDTNSGSIELCGRIDDMQYLSDTPEKRGGLFGRTRS